MKALAPRPNRFASAKRWAAIVISAAHAGCTTLVPISTEGVIPTVNVGEKLVVTETGSIPRSGCVAASPPNGTGLAFMPECRSRVEHIEWRRIEKLERVQTDNTRSALLVAGIVLLIAAGQYAAASAKLIAVAP